MIGFGPAKGSKPGMEEGGDSRSMAGMALAKALKSGDGAAIADAFEALKQECDGHDEMDEDPDAM